jgi:hypothetical protein
MYARPHNKLILTSIVSEQQHYKELIFSLKLFYQVMGGEREREREREKGKRGRREGGGIWVIKQMGFPAEQELNSSETSCDN